MGNDRSHLKLYNKHILPKLIQFLCSRSFINDQRRKIIPLAKGRVLEIGIGTGANLPFYDSSIVEIVWGLDLIPLVNMCNKKSPVGAQIKVAPILSTSECMPIKTDSVDTVVTTYTLCTFHNVSAALSEMKRVLKPEGQLLYCEHGIAPNDNVQRWQHRLGPIWKKLTGGCNLNRPIPDLIEQGGFRITSLEKMYISGFHAASFNYLGSAIPV